MTSGFRQFCQCLNYRVFKKRSLMDWKKILSEPPLDSLDSAIITEIQKINIPQKAVPAPPSTPVISPTETGERCNTITFEQSGDPVSCRFWFQVCWAVGLYQDQCGRDTDCRVYRFLKRQNDYEGDQVAADRDATAAKNKEMMRNQNETAPYI